MIYKLSNSTQKNEQFVHYAYISISDQKLQ
jgi:hypothetical protein